MTKSGNFSLVLLLIFKIITITYEKYNSMNLMVLYF